MKARHITGVQAQKVLAAIEADKSIEALYLQLLIYTGIRGADACRMTGRDILTDKGMCHIRGTKHGYDRMVSAPNAILTRISALIGQGTICDLLGITECAVRARLTKLWVRLRLRTLGGDLSHCTIHGLRATFAVCVYERTKNVLLVQEMLGHRSINSTMKYLRISQAEAYRTSILAIFKPNKESI